jgi:hypothetical protein
MIVPLARKSVIAGILPLNPLWSKPLVQGGFSLRTRSPILGQKERNSDHLLKQGVAIRCSNLPALACKIDTLIDTPGKLKTMSENARTMGKPAAAFTVVNRLVTLCQSHHRFGEDPARNARAHKKENVALAHYSGHNESRVEQLNATGPSKSDHAVLSFHLT